MSLRIAPNTTAYFRYMRLEVNENAPSDFGWTHTMQHCTTLISGCKKHFSCGENSRRKRSPTSLPLNTERFIVAAQRDKWDDTIR